MRVLENDITFQCYCGTNIPEIIKFDIRENVCKELPRYKTVNGNDYCILHCPITEKEIDFEGILNQRMYKNHIFNFQGVWFPSETYFRDIHFEEKLDFSYSYFERDCTFYESNFKDETTFENAIFNGLAHFQCTIFENKVLFNDVIFNKKVDFYSANFLDYALFENSIFNAEAEFCGAQFYKGVLFDKSVFKAAANFYHADFHNEENTSISFSSAEFNSATTFSHAKFALGADFSNTKFKDAVEFDGNYGGFVDLSLNFAVFEKPEKVLFFRIGLHPNWFIHVDSRKFIFTDIKWENLINLNRGVISELEFIKRKRNFRLDISNPSKLLITALRQLAENAENNNRFEEASNFRRMAFETEWIEKKERISNWLKNLVPESEKLKRRFSGSTDEEDKPNPPTNSFGVLRRSGDFVIHGLYRITSFYGESWSWAAFVLAFIIFAIFPFVYTQTEFQISPNNIPLGVVVNGCKDVAEELKPVCKIENRGLYFFREAVPHSLATASFQTVEYRIPKTAWGSVWIILEKIFAPLQAALLALAIRRKFMR